MSDNTEKAQPTGDAETCNRCGHQNPSWAAPSPLWNAVMRGGCINGEARFGDMVCAACFMVLTEEAGVATDFRVTANEIKVSLQTVTPTGRIWCDETQLWEEQPTGDVVGLVGALGHE